MEIKCDVGVEAANLVHFGEGFTVGFDRGVVTGAVLLVFLMDTV